MSDKGKGKRQQLQLLRGDGTVPFRTFSIYAHLAELVDALGLGSSGFGRGGSSPPVGIFQRSSNPW